LENGSGSPVDPTGNGPVGESWAEVDHDETQSPIAIGGRAWRVADYYVFSGAFGVLFPNGTVGVFCDTDFGGNTGIVLFQPRGRGRNPRSRQLDRSCLL